MTPQPGIAQPAPGAEADADGPLERLRRAMDDPARADAPRHLRLRAALLGALEHGDWAPGDKLPSEGAIAHAVGVSLGTAQKVLTHLAGEQVLVRRHGHGTFVTGDTSQANRLMHFRFIGDDGVAMVPVYAEAIERSVTQERGPWSDHLAPAQSFIRIRRRIDVDGAFDCISDFYIDAERFAPLLQTPFEQLHRITIRSLLANQFHAPTFAYTQCVCATRFPAAVAALMARNRVGDASFGVVLEIRSRSHQRQPVSFQNIFIPADVRKLELLSPRLLR
jgi:GntR family transcriptional regulator